VLGAAAVASALAFAWRLGSEGLPALVFVTAATVLIGGLAFLADRAAPPGQFGFATWPSGSFLAGSSDTGQGGFWTTGGFWTEQLVDKQPQATLYFAASCQSNGHCLAFGSAPLGEGVVLASSNAGATWTHQAIVGPNDSWSIPATVSCWDMDDCVIGGVPPEITSDGGRTWQTVRATGGRFSSAVDCTAPKRCLMAGDFPAGKTMLVTANGGKSWEPAELPPGTGNLASLSCTSATSCVAVGSTDTYSTRALGVIWLTRNGG